MTSMPMERTFALSPNNDRVATYGGSDPEASAGMKRAAGCPGKSWRSLTSSEPMVLRGGEPMPGMSA